jgi:hypothetical protein
VSRALLSLLPPDTNSVTDYYDQPVYHSADQKIGMIVDLLIDRDGQTRAAVKKRKPHVVLECRQTGAARGPRVYS